MQQNLVNIGADPVVVTQLQVYAVFLALDLILVHFVASDCAVPLDRDCPVIQLLREELDSEVIIDRQVLWKGLLF